ncbi:hypothetical protein [Paenisporosarcina sp. OV554]|uniref:hypothetical protein n=1 Tax=Paenisporosarcina sp. OV554 TaxID=2135694 RepID=UPI000D4B03F2|nr:hypothetical protein [Paenisporosarcina sp. OV554]PUB16783.1 hypothetical protein C8K15_102213 [Paenisporosarcina sp. OV554]
MATKSKSKASHWLSIVALAIGMLSLMYCYSFIQQLLEQGLFHSNRTIVQLTRILKGGA